MEYKSKIQAWREAVGREREIELGDGEKVQFNIWKNRRLYVNFVNRHGYRYYDFYFDLANGQAKAYGELKQDKLNIAVKVLDRLVAEAEAKAAEIARKAAEAERAMAAERKQEEEARESEKSEDKTPAELVAEAEALEREAAELQREAAELQRKAAELRNMAARERSKKSEPRELEQKLQDAGADEKAAKFLAIFGEAGAEDLDVPQQVIEIIKEANAETQEKVEKDLAEQEVRKYALAKKVLAGEANEEEKYEAEKAGFLLRVGNEELQHVRWVVTKYASEFVREYESARKS